MKTLACVLPAVMLALMCAVAPAEGTEPPERSEIILERAPGEAPAAEALAEDYLRVVAGIERGTAGASLKLAEATARVVAFAEESALWGVDADALLENLREAWESLSDGERDAFAENLPLVAELIEDSLADWQARRGVFEDAGAAEPMERLAEFAQNRLAWEVLRDGTRILLD